MATVNPEVDIVLTPEQVASAPPAVRAWLQSLIGHDDQPERDFVIERYGAATATDGQGKPACQVPG